MEKQVLPTYSLVFNMTEREFLNHVFLNSNQEHPLLKIHSVDEIEDRPDHISAVFSRRESTNLEPIDITEVIRFYRSLRLRDPEGIKIPDNFAYENSTFYKVNDENDFTLALAHSLSTSSTKWLGYPGYLHAVKMTRFIYSDMIGIQDATNVGRKIVKEHMDIVNKANKIFDLKD